VSGHSSALLQAAKLWEKTSGKGTRYMQGRLGGVKVLIMPNRDYVEGDQANGHTHILFFADGSATQPRPSERPSAEPREPAQRERPRKAAHQGDRQQIEDDLVPF
jgi:hypothetical protein